MQQLYNTTETQLELAKHAEVSRAVGFEAWVLPSFDEATHRAVVIGNWKHTDGF